MRAISETRQVTYQVYLRIQRGGTGVSYRAARDEFLTVMAALRPKLLHGSEARMRMQVELDAAQEARLITLAPALGYTEAIFRRSIGPLEEGTGEHVGRYLVGRFRFGDKTHHFEPLTFADEEERLASSPHNRDFTYLEDGVVVEGQRRHVHRRLSVCDARLVLNMALPPADNEESAEGDRPVIIDPFAGIGGIVREADHRGAWVLCGDVEAELGPGLMEASGGRAVIWDARALPLKDAVADAIATEPPYHRDLQGAVYASIPELCRVLKPGSRLALLIAAEMQPDIARAAILTDLKLLARYPIKRQKMQSLLLVYRRACPRRLSADAEG